MPDIVKVGYSTKDPSLRAEELNNTGSPHPYFVEFEILTEDPFHVEQKAHKILSENHEKKEWFRCTVEAAVKAIKQAAGKSILFENITNQNNISTINAVELKTQKKFVEETKVICPNCNMRYQVSLSNNESKSVCPYCRISHTVVAR